MDTPGPTTRELLWSAARGDGEAERALLERFGPDLHELAVQHLGADRDRATLQPTALVNEVWMKIRLREELDFANRHAFLAFASRAMRNLLIDRARARAATKRGGKGQRVSLAEDLAVEAPGDVELLDVEEALTKLEAQDAETARVVELRFYGGLTHEEIGEVLGWSSRKVDRRWQFARAWLKQALVE